VKKSPLAAIGLIASASLALACGSEASGPDEDEDLPTSTFLSFVSDPGDHIGRGQTRMYTRGAGEWSAFRKTQPGGSHVEVGFNDGIAGGENWQLRLAAPGGQQIAVGTYTGATRWPFHTNTASQPGLAFTGDSRGCNTVTGQFSITALRMGSDSTISHLAATFEQHCEGETPALRGEISITPFTP
jgi:hypothetical protein